ncbi:esterase [Lachnospiraceae bacterium oral taxon 500]|nr:esterase [Lachnospiraceae bacterium oral taxon 500]
MTVYEYGNPAAEIVLIQPVDEQDLSVIENEVNEIKRLSKPNFYLLAIKIDKWNDQLSPWPAPALFGKDNFGEGAKDTLEEILSLCADKDKTYIIGGYSLAGLFALWAAYQTDVFHAVAAASPSIWFLGFVDYMKNSEIKADKIYLSLGDKEEKTRNPVMASVGDCIREANVLLQEKGITTVLEWNQGNHFKDSDIRTAKAFAWVLNLDNSQDGKAN